MSFIEKSYVDFKMLFTKVKLSFNSISKNLWKQLQIKNRLKGWAFGLEVKLPVTKLKVKFGEPAYQLRILIAVSVIENPGRQHMLAQAAWLLCLTWVT